MILINLKTPLPRRTPARAGRLPPLVPRQLPERGPISCCQAARAGALSDGQGAHPQQEQHHGEAHLCGQGADICGESGACRAM